MKCDIVPGAMQRKVFCGIDIFLAQINVFLVHKVFGVVFGIFLVQINVFSGIRPTQVVRLPRELLFLIMRML